MKKMEESVPDLELTGSNENVFFCISVHLRKKAMRKIRFRPWENRDIRSSQ
jgi:hypothetical protein